MPEFFNDICPKKYNKMPNFYVLARKDFFFFWGGGIPPFPKPMQFNNRISLTSVSSGV